MHRRSDDEVMQAEWISPSEIMRLYPDFSYMALMRLMKADQWRVVNRGHKRPYLFVLRDELDAWLHEYGGPYSPKRQGDPVLLEPVKDGVRWRLNEKGGRALKRNKRPETRPPLMHTPETIQPPKIKARTRESLGGRPRLHVPDPRIPTRARSTVQALDPDQKASWALTHAVARELVMAGVESPEPEDLEALRRLLTCYVDYLAKRKKPRGRPPRASAASR